MYNWHVMQLDVNKLIWEANDYNYVHFYDYQYILQWKCVIPIFNLYFSQWVAFFLSIYRQPTKFSELKVIVRSPARRFRQHAMEAKARTPRLESTGNPESGPADPR